MQKGQLRVVHVQLYVYVIVCVCMRELAGVGEGPLWGDIDSVGREVACSAACLLECCTLEWLLACLACSTVGSTWSGRSVTRVLSRHGDRAS
jgi:hypothetical protein